MNEKLSSILLALFVISIVQYTESVSIGRPANVTVSNKTATSLEIRWDAVNDPILGYRVRYHINDTVYIVANSSLGNLSSTYVCNSTTSVCITGLEAYTPYWIEVVAFINGSFANESIVRVFRTDEGVPSHPPVHVRAVNQSSTSITVSWNRVPKGHRRGKIIAYIVNITDLSTGNYTVEEYLNNRTRNVTIHNLKKYTRYEITVSSKTSKGASDPSASYRVQTAEDVPEDPPTKINYTGVTADSIVITWQPVQGRLNGELRAYKVRWKEVNSTKNHTIETINIKSHHSRKRRAVSALSNETSFELKNLSLYTNHSVEVSAVTVGEGPYSDPVYVMSGEGVPTSPPVDVFAYNTSQTTIYVTWSPPDPNTIPGVLVGYEVSFTPASQNASATRRVMLCACNTSVELKTLTIYTLYNITVAAFTKVGIGNESDVIRTWTEEGAPTAAPENVTAVSETFSSIQVSWEPVPEQHRYGIITKYEVDVAKLHNASFDIYFNVPTENLTAEIPYLEMFVEYSVRVRAFTRIDEGPFSYPSINITTIETAPTVIPANVSAHATSSSSIRVTWDIGGLELGFKLRWCVVSYKALENSTWRNAKEIRVAEPGRVANLTGLRVFTSYEIKIAAATNFTGNYSRPINVTTREGVPQAPPANVRAAPETVSSIRAQWDPVPEPDRNGNITGYTIQVRNSSLYMVANTTVCGANFTAVIRNLEMFVTYSLRVQAFTGGGAGTFSGYVNTTTNQTVPDVHLNVTATGISNSSIRVTWEIERIHSRLNSPTMFNISYCPRDYCVGRNMSTETSAGAGVPPANLENLLTYVEYAIQVKAVNITAKDGTAVRIPEGQYSNPGYATTHAGVPQGPPFSVRAEPESTTSIRVSWEQVPWDKRGGIIIKYVLEVYNSSGKVANYSLCGNVTSYVVPGLQVYSDYSARVQALTYQGEGPFSAYQNTTTHQPAPNVVPQNVEAFATGTSTIAVTWNLEDAPSDIGFLGYRITYKAVRYPWDNGNDTVNNGTLKTTLSNLRTFTEYKIQVAARTTQDGNYSDPKFAKTLEGVPSAPPSNPYPETLDATTVRINWGSVPDDDHNGIIRGYRVLYKRAGNDTEQVKQTIQGEFSVLLKSLGKAAKYYVKVLAFTSVGPGVPYNFTFRTDDDVPSRPPVRLATANRVSPRSINVAWEPVPVEFRHGTVQTYEVTYQKIKVGDIDMEEEPVMRVTVEVGKTTVLLENLEPYVEYKISVAARTAKGVGPSAFVSGETCHCESRLTTSWRRYEPYVTLSGDGEPDEIIPRVLQAMVDECCGQCDSYKTVLDFKTNGNNRPSAANSSRVLLETLDEFTDFTFPVYGHNDQDSYKGGFGYIPVIESAGVAFIVRPQVSTTQTTIFTLFIRCLPVLLLPIVTAYIAGIIIWALERGNNPMDFPPSFLQGTWEGIWWAYVSMTTLGYGDRSPLSFKGRVFAIAWIMFGLVVIAVTMAMITSALTTVTLKSKPKLYGSLIAAELNSPEYNLGTRRNAKYDSDKQYHNLEEVAQALINKEVEGVLVDTYSAGLRGDLFNHSGLIVSKILDYKTAYGIVLSPSSTRLRTCFHRYMTSHKAEVSKMIESKVQPIETSGSNSTEPEKQTSAGLFDTSSPAFSKALRYAYVMFGIALFLSLTYECIRRIRTRKKVHREVQFKEVLQKEMCGLVEEFWQRMRKIRNETGEKHRRQIIKFWKLKRKSGSEKDWLRISQVSPHSKEVFITDMN